MAVLYSRSPTYSKFSSSPRMVLLPIWTSARQSWGFPFQPELPSILKKYINIHLEERQAKHTRAEGEAELPACRQYEAGLCVQELSNVCQPVCTLVDGRNNVRQDNGEFNHLVWLCLHSRWQQNENVEKTNRFQGTGGFASCVRQP